MPARSRATRVVPVPVAVPVAMAVAVVVGARMAAGCAHGPPMASTADPELCLPDRAAAPSVVAPHGDRVGLCYGDTDCLVVDHVRGAVVARTDLPPGDGAMPAELVTVNPPERFQIERTDTTTTICQGAACRQITLPGVDDQGTVTPVVSSDGARVSYVVREGDRAYLDTLAIATLARTGRVDLGIGNAQDHGLWTDPVGTAVLVHDSVSLGLSREVAVELLVDPTTGRKQVIRDGTAHALDGRTALIVDASGATIVDTATFAVLDARSSHGGAVAGVNGPVAVVALSNPPALLVVEHRRFVRAWRLPVCH